MKAIIRGNLDDNVIVSDFRGKKLALVNRFILYTLPGLSDGNISVQIAGGDPGAGSRLPWGVPFSTAPPWWTWATCAVGTVVTAIIR